MFSSHVILDFRVEDYPSLKRETEVSLFCHNQNSDFFGNWIGTNWFLNVWENLPVWYSKCWLNLIPMCGYCVCSVMSDSLWPHGLQPARLLHPWDFLGKNMGVDCYFLLQGIFLTQGLNPGLPHCRQIFSPFEPRRKLQNFKYKWHFKNCDSQINFKLTWYCSFLRHIRLFVTPWTAAQQASLSFTISCSLLKLMFVE